jgi:hypothetical protein
VFKEGRLLMSAKTTRATLISIIILLLAFSQVRAADLRCGTRIITPGDRKYDVLRKCGEPSNVTSWDEIRTKKEFGAGVLDPDPGFRRWPLLVEELVTIEEWEYNLGPNQFIRYLVFENNRLIRITEGDYGY